MKKTALIFMVLVYVLFFLKASSASAAQFNQQDFTSQSYCGTCHRNLFEQWSQSLHAKAISDPLFESVKNLAIEDMGGKDSEGGKLIQNYCLHCHTPIGSLTGDIPPTTAMSTNGISCDFCHTVSDIKGVGNGSFVNSPGNVKRGPYKDAFSPAHETMYSELHVKSEFCGMCHDVYHPTNGLPLETTYTEWKQGPYAEEGTTCQHCMMGSQNNARAAGDGPVRPLIRPHEFTGANVTMGSKVIAEGRLKKAATIKIKTSKESADPKEKVLITVTVTNSGAGHKIPTGLTELRDMWLEIKALDSENNEFDIYKETFNTILEDAQGKHDGHVPVWRAVKVFSDNRIGPKENRVFKRDFIIPAGTRGEMKVTAALKYRSASPSLTKDLGFDDFPVVEMAKANAGITVTDTGSLASPCRILSVILLLAVSAVLGAGVILRLRHGA